MNIRGVQVNTNYKQGKSLPQSLYNTAQEEDQIEQIREEINTLKDKFSTSIKLKHIKYYKIYGNLKEQ